MGARVATVAVDLPLAEAFCWTVPDDMPATPLRGHRVLVPWGTSFRTGIVLREDPREAIALPDDRLRPMLGVLDAARYIPEPSLKLVEWVSRYYLAPIGECVRLALPPGALPDAEACVEAATGQGERPAWHAALPPAPTPLRAWVKSVRGLRMRDVLEAAARGWVSLSAGQLLGAQATRESWLLRPRPAGGDPAPLRLGPRQRAVLDYLDEVGESTWDEVREVVDVPLATVRQLADRGLLTLERIEVQRNPFDQAVPLRTHAPALTDEQAAALAQIRGRQAGRDPGVLLLHGITGSGKTEVYLQAAREAADAGRQALVLLPEIALTPQLSAAFRAVLGDQVAIQHSGLTPGQRFDQWHRIRRGEVSVVVGARSALFAPAAALGLIIVDEEHDPSYKQDSGVLYHARDAATVLGHQTGALCVLGSATPSLESLHHTRTGRWGLARMMHRATGSPLPTLTLLDMRQQALDPSDKVGAVLSPQLQAAVQQTVRDGEQGILLLNRRGWAPQVQCTACQEIVFCPQCQVGLSHHRRGHALRCHWCGFAGPLPGSCPTCGSEGTLQPEGMGTQQLESLLEEAFAGMRVLRLDADAVRGRGVDRVLSAFRRREADLLIGTQMVAKGHDFPRVTLVGVLQADQGLRFPDIRSSERTLALITQVAGRAGRADRPGRVLIQSWNPDHPVMQALIQGDVDRWVEGELAWRQRMGYPPFGHLTLVRLHGPDWTRTREVAEAAAQVLDRHLQGQGRLVGPQDAPLTRLRNRFRIHILMQSPERPAGQRAARALHRWVLEQDSTLRRIDVRVDIDIDPQQML
jgi:primosomal protein N' (replication factor Y)